MSIEEMLQIHPFEDACRSLNGVSEEVRKIAFNCYKIGLSIGYNSYLSEFHNINFRKSPMSVTQQEYEDFMSLLVAFGYSFYYYHFNPEFDTIIPKEFHPGLNLIRVKHTDTLSKEDRKQIYALIEKCLKAKDKSHKIQDNE